MNDSVISSLAFGKRPNGFNYFVTYEDSSVKGDRVKVFMKTKTEQEAKIAKVATSLGVESILEIGEYN